MLPTSVFHFLLNTHPKSTFCEPTFDRNIAVYPEYLKLLQLAFESKGTYLDVLYVACVEPIFFFGEQAAVHRL